MPAREDDHPVDDEDRAERDDRDEREDKTLRKRLEQFVPDLVKRTFYAGLGAVFTTEEGIRKLAQDFSLPKDVANYLIQSASTTKDELFKIVARELREFLEGLNLAEETAKLLTTLSLEVKTEIRFIPNAERVGGTLGVKPSVKNKVAIKRKGEEEPAK